MVKCFACCREGINGGNGEVRGGLAEDESSGEEGEESWRWCLDIYHGPFVERFYIVRIGDGRFKYFSDASGQLGRVHISIRFRAKVRRDRKEGRS